MDFFWGFADDDLGVDTARNTVLELALDPDESAARGESAVVRGAKGGDRSLAARRWGATGGCGNPRETTQ